MVVTRTQSILYLALATCMSLMMLRNSDPELSVVNVPGSVPPKYEQKFSIQIDRPAIGYFYNLQIIHAGDLHGKCTPIDSYDYMQVIAWLYFLKTVTPQSEIAPFLATFYFSTTRNRHAVYQLIGFLKDYANENLATRWRWYTYGIYLAQHHLHDLSYAYHLAVDLLKHNDNELPLWVKDMPGCLLLKMNRKHNAQMFFQNILKASSNLSTEERRLLQDRLKSITD